MTNNERFPGNNIHDTVIIYEGVIIGTGNVIGPFCIIGAPAEWRGCDIIAGKVSIGNNNNITGLVTIDSGFIKPTIIMDGCYCMKHCHIGHDATIHNNVTISCGSKIGGHCEIYPNANVGLNAVIHQKQNIAVGCMIGMGAVVTKKLITEPYKVYAGNPAKLIGENIKHPFYNINQKEI